MNRATLRRILVAGILAATVGFSGAPAAHARETGMAARAWKLAQEAWNSGMFALWGRVPAPTPRTSGMTEKEGWGLDPNGATAPQPGAAPCASCGGDLGPGIDPNG